MMKQWIALLLSVMMLLTLTACGSEEAPADNGTATPTTAQTPAEPIVLSAIKDKMVTELALADVSDMHIVIMANTLGIDKTTIAETASFTAPGEVFPEEIYMIKANTAENATVIKGKLENKLASLKAQTQDYSPEDAALLKDAAVLQNDTYVAFFFSKHRVRMEEIYKSYF